MVLVWGRDSVDLFWVNHLFAVADCHDVMTLLYIVPLELEGAKLPLCKVAA